jgi:type IV secretory pathway TrbD component
MEAVMKTNVGNADRTLRLVAGVTIIALGVVFQSWWGAIGLIPLFTGTTRWCPVYLPFGISTCKKE